MRTDPLTDDGKIDTEFFASSEYAEEQKSLFRYLQLEGFESKKEKFVIDYRSRRWLVTNIQKDK